MTQSYYNAVQLSIEYSVTRIVMKLTSDLEFNCNNLPVLLNILTVTGVKHNFAINFLIFFPVSVISDADKRKFRMQLIKRLCSTMAYI